MQVVEGPLADFRSHRPGSLDKRFTFSEPRYDVGTQGGNT